MSPPDPTTGRWSPSTAPPSTTPCSKASCSATRKARSPAPRPSAAESSSRPTAARCFSTRSATCRSPFQEKILRVVEYGRYTRVGGIAELTTSARIIAATNRDLQEQIERGEFLADLYDRLTFETIHVPPLRERKGDVEVLARYFLDEFARETPSLGRKSLAPENVETSGNIFSRQRPRIEEPDRAGRLSRHDTRSSRPTTWVYRR